MRVEIGRFNMDETTVRRLPAFVELAYRIKCEIPGAYLYHVPLQSGLGSVRLEREEWKKIIAGKDIPSASIKRYMIYAVRGDEALSVAWKDILGYVCSVRGANTVGCEIISVEKYGAE